MPRVEKLCIFFLGFKYNFKTTFYVFCEILSFPLNVTAYIFSLTQQRCIKM